MGNLKNKNLLGDEILSQVSSITRGSADEDDDGVSVADDGDDDGDDVELASNAPTCGGDHSDEESDAPEEVRRAQPSTSTGLTDRARRSKSGPNFSRSRCF